MQTIYKADDGTEFSCPNKCKTYEQYQHLRFVINDMLTDVTRNDNCLSLKASLAWDEELKEFMTDFILDRLCHFGQLYESEGLDRVDHVHLKREWKRIRREHKH